MFAVWIQNQLKLVLKFCVFPEMWDCNKIILNDLGFFNTYEINEIQRAFR